MRNSVLRPSFGIFLLFASCQAPVSEPVERHHRAADSDSDEPSDTDEPGDSSPNDGCGTSCDDGHYTACTCGASDPCDWRADGYCDAQCAELYPNNHFSDAADCGSNSTVPENTAARCSDDVDNDADGDVDCDDAGCAATSACATDFDLAGCVDDAVETCKSNACATEYSALGYCYSNCGVFPEAWCIDDYCGAQVFAVTTCMLNECAALDACGSTCETGCAGLAACGNTTLDSCVASCGPLTPDDTLLMACGASMACGELSVCTSLETGCSGETWPCGDGACLSYDEVCNGTAQCQDQSDELGVCGEDACAEGTRLCDGTCMACPSNASATSCESDACVATACDQGYDICGDACCEFTGGCYSYEFACGDGTCIPEAQECDDVTQCADKSDEHRACPNIAPLYDPSRLSLAHECGGETMTSDELLGLIDPGYSELRIGTVSYYGDRVDFYVKEHSRTCNTLTGCSAWATESSAWRFKLTTDRDGKLRFNDGSYTSHAIPEGEADILLLGYYEHTRVRFAFTDAGEPCVQVTRPFEVHDYGGGNTKETYVGSSVTFREAVAGTALSEQPTHPGDAYRCTASPATTQEIANAWFPAGTSYVYLTDAEDFPRVSTSRARFCFLPTGCSTWSTAMPSSYGAASVSRLEIASGAISIGLGGPLLPITSGNFAGAAGYSYQNYGTSTGHVATSCIEHKNVIDNVASSYAPTTQLFTWERVGRSN